jgi:YfiH family protein
VFYQDSEKIYRVSALEQFDWLAHGFGTKWSKSFGSCGNLATLHQIHSNVVVDAAGRSGCLGEGDALVENTPGRLIAVKTADCLPVLIVDPARRAVAAVHAGWRGTLQNIVKSAIEMLAEKFSSRAEDLHVAIGPGIRKCCFEVGREVAARFVTFFPRMDNLSHKVHLDLMHVNSVQLRELGVLPGRIYGTELCTVCGGEGFCSYRREKNHAGRMLSVIGVR